MTSSAGSSTKNKQYMVVGGLVLGLLFVVYLGVRVTAPPEYESAKKDSKIDESITIAMPGEQADPQDVWRGIADDKLRMLEEDNKDMRSAMARYEARMNEMLRQTKEERDNMLTLPPQFKIETPNIGTPVVDDGQAAAQPLAEGEFKPINNIPSDITAVNKPQEYPPGPLPGSGVDQSSNRNVPLTMTNEPFVPVKAVSISMAPPAAAPTAGGKVSSPADTNNRTGRGSSDDNRKLGVKRRVETWMPAGSIIRSIILGGVDAPTGGQAQSDPHPVIFMLADDGILPNRYRGQVKECHAIGAAWGSISSERAYARLENISCIFKDGTVLDSPVEGYVTGEDGKTGMRGKLISKQGRIIAMSLMTGIGAGIGDAFYQSAQDTSTSALGTVSTVEQGKEIEAGVYRGVGNALDRLADYYIDLAEETYPVIEVGAGRQVELVLTRGLDLSAVYEDEELANASDYWNRGQKFMNEVKKRAGRIF